MTSDTVPHLCGGILFDLLIEARRPQRRPKERYEGGSEKLTIPDLYAGLVEIATGEDVSSIAGNTLKKCATNFRKCLDSSGDYVPFTKVPTQESFRTLYKTNKPYLLKRAANFINTYLNGDKCIWLTNALIETMQSDKLMPSDTLIAINYNEACRVSQLHEASEIIFLPFFLDVFHYVMLNCPDCESGKATFDSWYTQVGVKSKWEFKSSIGKNMPSINVNTDLALPQPFPDGKEPSSECNTAFEKLNNAVLDSASAVADRFEQIENVLAEHTEKTNDSTNTDSKAEYVEADVEIEEDQNESSDSDADNKRITVIQQQTNVIQNGGHNINLTNNGTMTFNL